MSFTIGEGRKGREKQTLLVTVHRELSCLLVEQKLSFDAISVATLPVCLIRRPLADNKFEGHSYWYFRIKNNYFSPGSESALFPFGRWIDVKPIGSTLAVDPLVSQCFAQCRGGRRSSSVFAALDFLEQCFFIITRMPKAGSFVKKKKKTKLVFLFQHFVCV